MRDGYETIDWVARQTWCDGRVGMYGDSYYGFTQWAAAASGHPALRAIVPRLTASEVGEVWMYPGDVFRLATMAWWAAYTWVDRFLYDVSLDWSVRPFAELLPRWLDGARSTSLDHWAGLARRSALWRRIVGGTSPARTLTIPALNVGGWWDVFHRGAVRDWAAAHRHGSAPQHLLLDSIDHYDDQLLPDGEEQPDMYASHEAMLAFLPRPLEPAVAFLDRYLKGETLPSLPPVRWKLVHAGWRTTVAWPPPEARPVDLFLTEAWRAGEGLTGGGLRGQPDVTSGAVIWQHDASSPVPSLEEEEWRPLMALPDERLVEQRDDVITFTGEPSGEPFDIAGPVHAELEVSSTGPALDVVAKLVDVFPSGRARRVAEGARRVASGGRETLARVDLGHAGYRVLPGHSLRLEVASSAFPRYLPYPGAAVDPWRSMATTPNTQTLLTGGSSRSRLRLFRLPSDCDGG